jgi:hypothetical protein
MFAEAFDRKPLKGRARIDDKSSRIIPIIDKQIWDGLMNLFAL